MEYKFRAWHKPSSTMLNWFTITQSAWNTYRGNERLSLIYDILVAKKEDYDVMLKFPLNDKDGSEFYEGDILLSDDGYIYLVCFGEHEPYVGEHCYGFHNGFYVKDVRCDDCFSLSSQDEFLDECKLLGNTYQNPELLKAK